MSFERRRPPFVTSAQSLQMAQHAKRVYAEFNRELILGSISGGDETDAAFAAQNTEKTQ